MKTRYKRGQEFFEAVQFIRLSEGDQPEFDHSVEWINYALTNKLLNVDGVDLLWGYKMLDRRVKPGSWIVRSKATGGVDIKSDPDFRSQFEVQEANII